MSDSSYDVDDRVSSGSGNGIHLGAYAGTEWGQTALRAGLTYSDYRLKTDRHAAIGEMAAPLSSKYNGHVWQAFAEVGHRVDHGNMALEPMPGWPMSGCAQTASPNVAAAWRLGVQKG